MEKTNQNNYEKFSQLVMLNSNLKTDSNCTIQNSNKSHGSGNPDKDEMTNDSKKVHDKGVVNGLPSRLKELKYSLCSDEELPELAEEMLFRAAHPKKIGIFSSGGLSNQIVDEIESGYSDQFESDKFDTYFETFDKSMVFVKSKVDIDVPIEEPKEDVKSTEIKYEKIDASKDLKIDKEKIKRSELSIQEQTTKSIGIPANDEIKFEDEEFIFEPSTDSYDEAPHKEIEDIKEGDEIKKSVKHLSFKERAQLIFQELKRKLGLIPKPAKVREDMEPDKVIKEKAIGGEMEREIEGDIDRSIERDVVGGIKRTADHEQVSSIESTEGEVLVNELVTGEERQGLDLETSTKHKIEERQKGFIELVKDKDILFIFTCLDDEYDFENTIAISELARKMNILTIVVASLPRYFGKVEKVYAMNKTLQKLRLTAEIVILMPYFETFDFKLIPRLIQELLEVITEPGLINVDVADLKIIVKGGNVGVVTFGFGKHATRHKDALFEALDSILLNVELGGVNKALLNVTGGKDMMLAEVEGLAEQIKSRIKSDARIILGTSINPALTDSIKIFLLLGVTPMQVMINIYANE